MKVHSIISNTISEEILQTGHLSIRFLADGFSLLLEDKNFRPIILNRFTEETPVTKTSLVSSCIDWLNRHTLIDNFAGEVTIISDSNTSVLVPKELFSKTNIRAYLESSASLGPANSVEYNKIKTRPFVVVYPVSETFRSLAENFQGKVRIQPCTKVLLSMADQVNASDHQRGFVLIEVQEKALNILMIKKDKVEISNQLRINKSEDIVYHTLNTLQLLDFKRKKAPLFVSGIIRKQELDILNKYIKKILPLPYHIQDIEKSSIPEHILLAEASRCE